MTSFRSIELLTQGRFGEAVVSLRGRVAPCASDCMEAGLTESAEKKRSLRFSCGLLE
jgi:hypothetical protein